MKKTVLKSTLVCFTFVLCLFGLNASAQDMVLQNDAEKVSSLTQTLAPNAAMRTSALWDVLFNYDVSTVTGAAGYAGMCFVNNEYWVAKWASDTISIFDAAGSFVRKVRVTGVTGIRSMTWDGTNIYAGVNTNSVKIIAPNSTTPTLAGTITMPTVTGSALYNTVRFITYDPTANAGAGGFWIGNYDTDLMQVSMTGTSLNSITSSSHGVGGMYGATFDNYTAGGPYIWVCDQNGLGGADLIQISIATGLQTGVVHDVGSDVGLSSTGPLGGGIFMHIPSPGVLTLMGCLQGAPNLVFGYDMNVFVGLNEPVANGSFLSVTPSVSNSLINIKLDKQNNHNASIQIIDALGKVVLDKNSKGMNNYMDVSSFRSGVYFVRVSFDNNTYTTKFVKN